MSDIAADPEQTSKQRGLDVFWAIFRRKQQRATEAAQDLCSALTDSEVLLENTLRRPASPLMPRAMSIIVRAKQASTEGWPNQDYGKLTEALTKLAVATRPVTACHAAGKRGPCPCEPSLLSVDRHLPRHSDNPAFNPVFHQFRSLGRNHQGHLGRK